MKRLKIAIVGWPDYKNYAKFIRNGEVEIISDDNISSDTDLVLFAGGSDVDPIFYNEKKGYRTSSDTNRDVYESEVFAKTFMLGVPMIGICRGAQFITVMNGGRLIQHVDNHGIYGYHSIVDRDGNKYEITSTHHQMMYPFDLKEEDYEILAWTPKTLATMQLNGDNKQINLPENFVEPEIVFYNKTKCLCIQGHPEMMHNQRIVIKYLNKLINELLLNK